MNDSTSNALEVDQQPAETGHSAVERVPRCGSATKTGTPCSLPGRFSDGHCLSHTSDPTAVAARQAGRSKGGSMQRRSVPIGIKDLDVQAFDLSKAEDRLALYSATVSAAAHGRVTSNTATAIVNALKGAAADAAVALEDRIADALQDLAEAEAIAEAADRHARPSVDDLRQALGRIHGHVVAALRKLEAGA